MLVDGIVATTLYEPAADGAASRLSQSLPFASYQVNLTVSSPNVASIAGSETASPSYGLSRDSVVISISFVAWVTVSDPFTNVMS